MGGDLKIIFGVVGFLAIAMFVVLYGTTIGLTEEMGTQLVVLLPGIVLFFVCAIMIANVGVSVYFLPSMTLLGVSLAYLIGQLYTLEILVIPTSVGITVGSIQLMLIVVCALIGGALAAVNK